MSQMHYSVESIMSMLDRGEYSSTDITEALADLEAMWDDGKGSIKEYTYKNVKKLLEDKQ